MHSRKSQPEWVQPTGPSKGLMVNNSLKVDAQVPFIPRAGNLLRWYNCGPTVYDHSHLGHARTYLTFDIIRRITEDYFGFDMFLAMNITDIDDKIILRSRRNYFFDQYIAKNTKITAEMKDLIASGWATEIAAIEKKIAKIQLDQENPQKNQVELAAAGSLQKEKLAKAQTASKLAAAAEIGVDALPHLNSAKDQVSAILDADQAPSIDSEFVKELCDKHSKHFERDYFEDMKALGIKTPDVVVRVSEYVPEVVKMVEGIIANGFGYASEGSVYFDSSKFHNDDDHVYGKLEPWSIGDLELVADGEGTLAAQGVRKSPSDFALWKKSKPGEPSWDSPWGRGRPGWHIECSAMATEVLGDVLDVHCGGVDLKFPHHDNELAQAEAFTKGKQWVNYFFHSGHLDIDGLKMSKSLKNFITIKEALESYSPLQLRMLFLLQSWDKKMNYQVKNTMEAVDSRDKSFRAFFEKVKMIVIERDENVNKPENWNSTDIALNQSFLKAKEDVHAALCNNFDTVTAIYGLSDLVHKCNVYMSGNDVRKALLLSKIAEYVLKILNVFGLPYTLGGGGGGSGAVSADDREAVARPFVTAITDFRSAVRSAAKEKAAPGAYMDLCDALRDEILPQHGVKVVDDNEFKYFFVDKETLLKEFAADKAEKEAKAIAKAAKAKVTRLAGLRRELEAFKKMAVTPTEFIKAKLNCIVEDADNLPTQDVDGKDLSKGALKKIPKFWKQQQTKYDKYQAELAKSPTLIADLEKSIAELAD
eukprot:TRINITY_DN178_c0_g1_i9.p1 TRINITY_DN178_c0_g1~~TRINITY_DN178_c0_g1_i9.p1  ORF type:complete len:760 (+),score=251.64 TRINITY_DN178_c0_g1_i9:145-2424(+)